MICKLNRLNDGIYIRYEIMCLSTYLYYMKKIIITLVRVGQYCGVSRIFPNIPQYYFRIDIN